MSAADGWRSLSFEKKLTVVGVPLLMAVLSSLVIAPLSSMIINRKSTQLEVVALSVTQGYFFDPPPAAGPGATAPAVPATNYVPPSVEMLVRNTGDLVSVVSSLRFEVSDHGIIAECPAFPAGKLEVSAEYDVVLPAAADAVGEVVDKDVSQAIEPGDADRFSFRMTVPPDAHVGGTHVHELEVTLERDGGEEQRAGVALVTSLVPVSSNDSNLRPLDPVTEEALGSVGAAHADCVERNRSTYGRFKDRLGLPDLDP